jgi:hypothetical protein
MKFATTSTVMLCLASAIACTNQAEPPKIAANGVVQYTTSRTKQTVPCDGRPIDIAGDRNDMTLTGSCQYVRVSGAHNDIYTDVTPGGTIEVTGDHNDVSWRQSQPGPPPNLQGRGESNTFHHLE